MPAYPEVATPIAIKRIATLDIALRDRFTLLMRDQLFSDWLLYFAHNHQG